ncbi:MAG: shikimate dehydrogenase [Victivallales bacterium]|nr:shikimate dehydrogenase [Victivallales bacterium]
MQNLNRNKLAVIGDPIKHSLSPVMHNAAIKSLDLKLSYSSIKVEYDRLEAFIKYAGKDYLGLNVTLPHKKNIIRYLDEIEDTAKFTGSVNTVKFDKNGRSYGCSTDGFGLEMALKKSFGIKPENNNFLFIGCGGAAQACAAHLLERGAKSLCFVNRSIDKALEFAEKLKRKYFDSEIVVYPLNCGTSLEDYLKKRPAVIQSTSIGLNDSDPLVVSKNVFKQDLCYFDMIYRKTKFLEHAESKGAATANGILMLLYQGVKAFSLWTEMEPPVEVMKKSLYKALGI